MNQELQNEVVRLYRGKMSMRRIGQRLGISRYRVAQILAAHQAGRASGTSRLPAAKKKRSSCLDEHEQTIEQLLQRYPDITAVRMHQELRKCGFRGSYGIVKRRLRQLRGPSRREFVQRFETAPGLQGQMDYSSYTINFSGEGRRRVHLFSYVLGYSRRQYLRFVTSQDFITTIREHVRAFHYLGGVAATCLYDNMKVVVRGYDGDIPLYNPRFLAFATHYGFRPVACRPRRSQTKGKVERPFHYVEVNLLNGRTFHSLDHLNDVTAWWLQNVADVRIHRETKQRPIDRFQDERPHLIALPDCPYDTAEVVYRCVTSEGHITYSQNRYSVPWHYIGLTLPVRVTETEVVVYGPEIEEIARHRLFGPHEAGQVSACDAHRPSNDSNHKYVVLKQRFEALGEAASRFFAGLQQRRGYGKSEACKILALLETYHRRDLLSAIERALRYGAYSRSAVERILAVRATPKTTLDHLADREQKQLRNLLDDEPVQPRPAKAYQALLDPISPQETDHESTGRSHKRRSTSEENDPQSS